MKRLVSRVAALLILLAALSAGGLWLSRWYARDYSFGPSLELIAETRILERSGRSQEAPLPHASKDTPNILLISVDTLRADHLGAYGHSRESSLAVDALAEDGIVFERAFVTVPKTTPSLASLLSGLAVKTHRVHKLRIPLDDSIPLLPEILRKRGYATAGFCGQFNCDRRWGLGRGFEHYDDDFDFVSSETARSDRVGGGFYPSSEKRAAYLVDEAIKWLESNQKADGSALGSSPGSSADPFFVWLHLMDPHAGYSPPESYQQLFSGSSTFSQNSFVGERIPGELIHIQAKRAEVDAYDDYLNLYDAEIRYADDQIGRLFDFLKQNGLYNDALIVFTSDHGEYMGESSAGEIYFNHGATLFDSELRIPMIVKLPANLLAGTRSARLVSIADVVPTVLSYLGHEAEHTEGSSLLAAVPQLRATAPRDVVFSQGPSRQGVFSGRSQNHKLIFRTKLLYDEVIKRLRDGQPVSGRYQLYDLASDPLERNPLAAGHEAIAADLAVQLANWLAKDTALAVETRDATTDQETMRHLRALGYVE